MARLVVITKDASPSVHELGDGWITIGRADDNIYQIVEQSVSGHHCEVRARGDELLVRDLISTNGTFIAGRKISEGVVKAGDILRLGDIELRFEAEDAASVAAVAGTVFTAKMLVTRAAAAPKQQPAEKRPATPPPVTLVNEPGKRFQVLFVDDSLAFLESFGGLCAELSGLTWNIHKATSADAALTILRDTPMDLIVLDIGMPMLDGLQLLGMINRRYPGLKIAVITGQATEARRADALAKGAELFIEKPVTPEGMQSVFNMLLDLVLLKREGFTGALRQVNLEEVIQVECTARRSSILEVRTLEMHGQIYLQDGAVVHAAAGELFGEAAVHRLLSLHGGEFQLKPFRPPSRRTINTPWEYLIMNSAQVKDEETAMLKKAGVPAPSSPTSPGDAAAHIVVGENLVPLPAAQQAKPPQDMPH